MSGSVFDTRFEDILFDGRDTHGYGTGSLRVKSARGRGVRFGCAPAGHTRGHWADCQTAFLDKWSKQPRRVSPRRMLHS